MIESDSAPLTELVRCVLEASDGVRCMRDPTRGVASALNELAAASRVGVTIDEASIPIQAAVHSACEVLGLDPVAVVAAAEADRVLHAMRKHPLGQNAAIIGDIVAAHPGMVTQRTRIGGERIVTLLAGEQLPRIC